MHEIIVHHSYVTFVDRAVTKEYGLAFQMARHAENMSFSDTIIDQRFFGPKPMNFDGSDVPNTVNSEAANYSPKFFATR